MPKDGNDSDGLGEAHPALWESKLSRANECRVRSKCFIPKFIKIWFDEKSGAVVRSDCHEVYMYETMFKAGFRLPFLPVVWEFLGYLDLAPHQIALNAWRVFHSCMVLWPLALEKQHQLSVREFLYLHRVHKNPGGSGVYNIQTRRGRLIQLEPKYSSNRGWKNRFFFALGQWEFTPTEKAQDHRVRVRQICSWKRGTSHLVWHQTRYPESMTYSTGLGSMIWACFLRCCAQCRGSWSLFINVVKLST